MLKKFLKPNGVLATLFNSIENNEKISVFGCGLGEKLNIAVESDKFILYVCNNEKDFPKVVDSLKSMGLRTGSLSFNPSFNNIFIDKNILRTLNLIIDEKLDALVVNPISLLCLYPSKEYLLKQRLVLSKSQEISITNVIEKLTSIGFERCDWIEDDNTFIVKGDIIDIKFENRYFRLVWDWDTLAKIKECDIASLMPIEEVEELTIYGDNFLNIDQAKLQDFKGKCKDVSIVNYITEHESICANNLWFLPFNNDNMSNLYMFSDNICIVFDDVKMCYDVLNEGVEAFNNEIKSGVKEKRLLTNHLDFLFDKNITLPDDVAVIGFQHITNANRIFSPKRVFNLKCLPRVSYKNNWELLVSDVITKPSSSVQIIFAKSQENANKISSVFDKKQINYNIATSLINVNSGINIITKSRNVSCYFIDENIYVYGSDDLCGEVKKVDDKNFQALTFELPEKNDIVVHSTYGVGRCLGVECLKLSDSSRDYVIIEYKNNDRLYLPVENINMISKYIGNEKAPALNKLGSNDFIKTKEKVKSNIKEMAFSLVELYKSRLGLKGYKYPKDDEMMKSFCDSFEFTETADQLRAINDISQDMEEGKVMDRLVCGDVGFGKTEVAMRAAFKTVLAGKQVAFMCPTTILSEQHYNTLLSRMKNFGVSIEVLNRFKTKGETEKIFAKVKEGKVDILVGTHKLLNKNLEFKNLGLLILDEEQKFGVEAKETIKELKKNINVLTLSATPIPRTLNMALSGIRDISVIETPPVSRIPTQVQVCEYNDMLVKTAIMREIERGGQVLITYNRVEDIYEWTGKVKLLVGNDITIGVAHGQMEESELENAIKRLYNGETQVLISTTLIENGVDLPNANTLIVIDADKLGLSQLYQLKGRIGRGDRQAYAYFTYSKDMLEANAYKRLEAISEFTAMGSGFKIALRDLEIRGAGNVLGVEQHGHMQKVGYALYIQLLNEAVSEIKGETLKTTDVKVETLLNAYIPKDYIVSYNARISTYMKISKIDDMQKLVDLFKQINETFGTLPEEVVNLCKISLIKNLAGKLLANKVVLKKHECNIYFDKLDNMEKIVSCISNFDNVVLEAKNLPIIYIKVDGGDILDKSINFLELCSI